MKKLTLYYIFCLVPFLLILAYWNFPPKNFVKSPPNTRLLLPKFRHALLLAHPRTGSTVIAKTITNNDAIFYSLEPINIGIRSQTIKKSDSNNSEWKQFLKEVFLCNFRNFFQYRRLRRARLWHLASLLVKDLCFLEASTPKTFCDFDEFNVESVVCNRSKMHLVKTIYLPLKTALALLADPHLDLALIYLVRDPRGILHSRKYSIDSSFFFASSLVNEEKVCRQMKEEIADIQNIEDSFRHR